MPGAEVRPRWRAPSSIRRGGGSSLARACCGGAPVRVHPSKVTGGRPVLIWTAAGQSLRPREKAITHTALPLQRVRSFGAGGMRELVPTLQKRLVEAAGPLLEAIRYQRQYSARRFRGAAKRLVPADGGGGESHLSLEEIGAIRSRIIAEMERQGYELRCTVSAACR